MASKLRSGKYSRVVLKLSGEALQTPGSNLCMERDSLSAAAGQIKDVVKQLKTQIAIVVGGGNFFRGINCRRLGIERDVADAMGMLATVINALAMQSALQDAGLDARVQSAIEMTRVVESFARQRAIRHLERGRVVIFAGGTGNPYFSTDTAAALRACQIGADAVLKATKVDGVYSGDPLKDSSARRFRKLRYIDAINRNLKVMDPSAFALCMENRIPIVVFDFFKRGNLLRVLAGEEVGTLVCG